jgi:hypothetical protein
MRRLARALPLLLVLTACSTGQEAGGDSLEDRRAAYLEQVEAACSAGKEELDALEQPTSIAGIPDYADAVVALLSRTVSELSTPEPPEEDRAEVTEKVLDPLAADVARGEEYAQQVRAAADSGDSAALLEIVSETPSTTADVAFMREYGMETCADAAEAAG